MIPPPEGLVQLSTLPQELWVGREVWHPMFQVGSQPYWREVDYPEGLKDEEDTSEEWAYDHGVVTEFIRGDLLFKRPGWVDHWRVYFKSQEAFETVPHWKGLEYDSTNLWTLPEARRPLTLEVFAELVEEGRKLSEQFDRDSAPMRQITAEDLARRCR